MRATAMEMGKIDVASADRIAPERPRGQRLRRLAMMLSVPLLIALVGGYYLIFGGRYATTDNAYVQRDKVSISAEVTGRLVEVGVHENQHVRKGDLLFRIDPEPYRIALEQADAAVASARLKVAELQSDLAGKGADITGAQADIAYAREEFQRQQELMRRGFTTRARFDEANHALQEARKTMANAQAEQVNARTALVGAGASISRHPLVMAAIAQRDRAALDLQRTTLVAPRDGVVSQADRLQVGQLIMASLPVVTLVSGDTWVEANFKETQLDKMRVGQPAEIEVDAYPGKLRARVSSVGAGTGSEFSILPAQNATGNWVKVVQRVPVRLQLLDKPARPLSAGLSANVSVDTQGRILPPTPQR